MKQQDFDEYIRQVEPSARESAFEWQTAIGLQQVDGLQPSQYLLDAARRNIDGDITIDEVRQMLDSYYSSKTGRTPIDDDKAECDKASANIKKILSSPTFAFNTNGFVSTHRRIFEGVFKHAGELRPFDITKKEWVLRGDTVRYLNWEDLRRALDYDIQQERQFSYKGLSELEKVRHLCRFVSGLWQIHPFREGNTRTTAVFAIQYFRSLGYEVTNNLFKEHSWYFRNALVRANYKNARLGIDYDFSFLERFFRNLLLLEHNELKNRSMLVAAPEGWEGETPSVSDANPTLINKMEPVPDDKTADTDDKTVGTDDKVLYTDDNGAKTDDKTAVAGDKTPITDDKLTMIISFLEKRGSCKTAELSDLLGLKPTQTKAYIYQLLSQGKIVAHGANRNRTYTLA